MFHPCPERLRCSCRAAWRMPVPGAVALRHTPGMAAPVRSLLATGVLAALVLVPAGAAAAAPAGGCGAAAQIGNQWGTGSGGGEILLATVTNTSTVVSTEWTVTWSL